MDSYAGALQYIGADGVPTRATVLPMHFGLAKWGPHPEVSPYAPPKSAQNTTATWLAPLCVAKNPFGHPGDGP
uniref:Uncharacterized protein n=1 Tax=Romanomermis culicivorax TaxID=13658 RepID=A0A915JGE9_ROMCU